MAARAYKVAAKCGQQSHLSDGPPRGLDGWSCRIPDLYLTAKVQQIPILHHFIEKNKTTNPKNPTNYVSKNIRMRPIRHRRHHSHH